MPAKVELGSSPVYHMEHERQVSLLSDALLREYMHRKGFRNTLSAFDKENPRDSDTVSSRAVMADLMDLLPEQQQRLKREGIETIMEMLCDLRIERRQEVESLRAKASMPLPEVPAEYLSIIAKRNQKAAEKKSKLEMKELRLKGKKKQRRSPGQEFQMKGIPLETEMTMEDLLETDSDVEDTKAKPVKQQEVKKKDKEVADPSEAPPSWLQSSSKQSSTSPSTYGNDDGDAKELASDQYKELRSSGTPCEAEVIRSAAALFTGGRSSPPRSFLQQGICFDDAVGFRLIQWEHGSGAAIAPIQSFTAAFYFENFAPESQEHQRHSCRKALMHILLAAQPDVSRIVLVDSFLSAKNPMRTFQRDLDTEYVQWTSFNSAREVEVRLTALMNAHWLTPKSSGLWSFLLTLVMSRGVSVVRADSRSSASLIDDHGNGTMGLANLLLCGVANESHYQLEQHLQCGVLLGELQTNPSHGNDDFPPLGSAKNPVLPSWVVCHEKHFSNIFMKKDTRNVFEQKRSLGGSASVSLTFWDALTDDDEASIEVQVSGAAWGGRRRNESSFVNNAILSVPPWATGVVDWKGAPIPR